MGPDVSLDYKLWTEGPSSAGHFCCRSRYLGRLGKVGEEARLSGRLSFSVFTVRQRRDVRLIGFFHLHDKQLLGGKTKERLPVYATTTRPDLAKKMGFKGAKVPLPYGPGDGDEGMRANIERLCKVRESVGKDFSLAVDCYMSLSVPYTIELARRIEKEVPGGVCFFQSM